MFCHILIQFSGKNMVETETSNTGILYSIQNNKNVVINKTVQLTRKKKNCYLTDRKQSKGKNQLRLVVNEYKNRGTDEVKETIIIHCILKCKSDICIIFL